MATADYWSSADLKGIADGGLIHEDVMNEIWDISNVPLPFTDLISSDSADNSYTEWTIDKLATPDVTNALVDGADATGNDAKGGARVGNQCQISGKVVTVTQRANASNTIGRAQELAYQVMERQKELRRDREAIYLTQQASVADNGDATAGKLGGFGAWLTSNTDRGATGADGGFSSGVVATPTIGTVRALSETAVRDMSSQIWEGGGDTAVIMSIPSMIRKFSDYLLTPEARIATLTSETTQSETSSVAKGAVNVFVTDFGQVLSMVANRIMQPEDDTDTLENTNLYFIDPAFVRTTFLEGYNVKDLAKVGLADKRQMTVDGSLKVLNEEAHGVIADLDYTLDVVA